jgi:signal transduction histidine kinase
MITCSNFMTRGNFLIALLATGLIAILFQPLRTYLQRNVNRLIYGERDDPYTVLSRLRQRLEVTLTPAAVLPTIVETVALALKLPYVAITLKHEDNFTTAASYGTPGNELIRLPLIYQAEQHGELLLAPRAPGEKFSSADQRLLHDLANEIGVAVHATRLTADLQRLTVDLQHSRERLVLAREEERRRLRRDLHDDLGPTLAALALTATTVSELIPSDPTTATTLATDLQNEIRATVGNVRRLVYELRPPTLDELGVIAAVRERAAQVAQQSSAQGGSHGKALLQTRVHAPEKYAQAHSCAITIACDDVLQIEIVDDGIGLPTERHRGVGLHSMRERAAELGGTCVRPPPTAQGAINGKPAYSYR